MSVASRHHENLVAQALDLGLDVRGESTEQLAGMVEDAMAGRTRTVADPPSPRRIETAEVGRAIGAALADRNIWRHYFNRVRSLLDLSALDTERCSTEDGETTVEHVRMVVRDSETLADYKRRARQDAATISRLQEQAKTDMGRLREQLRRINELEAKILTLGGEP